SDLEQRREAMFAAVYNIDKYFECSLRFPGILLFEFGKPVNLQLLFRARRPRKFHFRNFIRSVAVSIQPNNRPSPVVNLLLITMRGVLNLAALKTIFDCRKDPTKPLDF